MVDTYGNISQKPSDHAYDPWFAEMGVQDFWPHLSQDDQKSPNRHYVLEYRKAPFNWYRMDCHIVIVAELLEQGPRRGGSVDLEAVSSQICWLAIEEVPGPGLRNEMKYSNSALSGNANRIGRRIWDSCSTAHSKEIPF